jgi:hypothetical protein
VRRAILSALVLALAGCDPAASPGRPWDEPPLRYDVVVYGGTSAGVTAAVQARRMGRSVVLLEPGRHLGGLTSSGLGNTDIGNKGAIGGLSRTFYEKIAAHYARPEAWVHETRAAYLDRSRIGNQGHGKADPVAARTGVETMWVFEPSVAESVFEDMVEEAGVPVDFEQRLLETGGVTREGATLRSIRMEGGRTYEAGAFVDATYEGDLMAAAGVSYTVGREGNDVYGETLDGVQTAHAVSHQFKVPVDPYRRPGRPGSGLLFGVHEGGPGAEGSGDRRVQAYNFRLTLTDAPANALPIPRPEGYDSSRYELLRRYIAKGVFDALDLNSPMPNRKTDVNNHGAFSSDFVGANYDYPEGDRTTRERIVRAHVSYVMGMWYFLQNDPRLPERVRRAASRFGLCRDEFPDNGHWPRQLYVREARRMVNDHVMSEHHCRGERRVDDPVGLAAYGMDSHNTQRYVADGSARNEGDVQVGVPGPYPVGYGAIVPRRSEATNLLVPVALAASHIAYGSIRMEPVFMILGQSAATAAVLALEGDGVVQDVEYARLRERLLADGQILEWSLSE